MKLFLTPLFVSALFALAICYAQTSITVNLGETASIPIKIDTTSTCNVEVTLAGKREQMTVEPTNPQLLIPFEGTELGVFDLKWEGKFRARGLKSVAACNGGGMVKVSVIPNAEQRRAEWVKFFANLPSDSSRQCVKVGLSQKGLIFESIDPQARVESPSSSAARDVFAKCDSFFSARTQWGSQDKEDFPCTPRGGVRTRCRGVYAEQMPDGRLRTISFEEAVKFHFEGRSWTTGVIETVQARIEREEQSRVAQERREAEIAANKEAQEKARIAKIEADERERKFRESPEYKRQQAELERQKAAEAKAAEERARKEKQAAEVAERQQREEREKLEREAAAREREKIAKKREEDERTAKVCTQMKSWASDSRELIARGFSVPMASVSLIRFEFSSTTNRCLAVVDTAKGPTKCTVGAILQDKKTGEYFASMSLIPFAIQAVCGSWAF
jgi:hypothetical protein